MPTRDTKTPLGSGHLSQVKSTKQKLQVVIIGGGFGGLAAAKQLTDSHFEVVVIDRCNHHLFQPLLYQVATADLSPADIAWPIRNLLARHENISVVLDEVVDVDRTARRVRCREGSFDFDYLIVAAGAATGYFGQDSWSELAPGLKTLKDATSLRTHILTAFERAERSDDPDIRQRLLNFVVIGGGPTGVEIAGALAELAKAALARDFRQIDPGDARIILVEAGEKLLNGFPSSLSGYAERALRGLGVEVLKQHRVVALEPGMVQLEAQTIAAETTIWAAGVEVQGPESWLGADADRSGRIHVAPDLSLPDHPHIFVIGDAARVPWRGNELVPGIAPAAKQQGRYVGKLIKARERGKTVPAFAYRHAGNLATIGRHRAVVDLGRLKLKGALAWWFWGLIHIYFLIDARSATTVLLQWFWTYLTRKKGARLITD